MNIFNVKFKPRNVEYSRRQNSRKSSIAAQWIEGLGDALEPRIGEFQWHNRAAVSVAFKDAQVEAINVMLLPTQRVTLASIAATAHQLPHEAAKSPLHGVAQRPTEDIDRTTAQPANDDHPDVLDGKCDNYCEGSRPFPKRPLTVELKRPRRDWSGHQTKGGRSRRWRWREDDWSQRAALNGDIGHIFDERCRTAPMASHETEWPDFQPLLSPMSHLKQLFTVHKPTDITIKIINNLYYRFLFKETYTKVNVFRW